MQRAAIVSSILLLACAFYSVEVDANRGLPVPIQRPCVGTCCQNRGSVEIARFCSTQYAVFPGGDTIQAATVMSSLVSSISSVSFANNRDQAACIWRNRLSQYGADFVSVTYFFQKDVTVTAGGQDFTLTGGAAVFTAGSAVYVVFGGVVSAEGFSSAVTNYDFEGRNVKVSALFYNYYKLYTAAGRSIIQEAIAQYNDLPGQSTKDGITLPRRIFVTGWSAGGIAALFAALDLEEADITVDGVYVFGNSKPGYRNFVNAYVASEVGAVTTVWWNGLDVVPVLPPANAAQAKQITDNQPAGDQEIASWGTDPRYARLPGSKYWRVAPPSNIFGRPAGTCIKVISNNDVWYDPCPSRTQDPNDYTCGLNFFDHEVRTYHRNIKSCALANYDKTKPPPRGFFNPTCINDLALPAGF